MATCTRRWNCCSATPSSAHPLTAPTVVACTSTGLLYGLTASLFRYLGIAGKKLVTEPGVLDNVEEFLRDMAEVWEGNASDADLQEKMTQEDQRCTLSILLLALLLDGKMGAPERELFKQACDAVGDKKIARYYDKRLRHLSLRFRGYDNITAQDLRDCFDPQASVSIPWNFTLQNWATRFMEFILC